MHAFLLSIGVIATAIGMFTIGFGIPINEFSFGNTLIISGTIAVAGGAILVGIAAAVRDLRRIADALGARQLARAARPEMADAPGLGARGAPAVPRPPLPQRPSTEAPVRDPRPPESRSTSAHANNGSAHANNGSQDDMSARARQNILPMVRAVAETTVVEEPESVPLSPQVPARAAAAASARGGERMPEPKAAQPPLPKLNSGAAAAMRTAVLELPRMMPADRLVERPQHANLFDSLWPAGSKPDVAPAPTHDLPGRGAKARSEPGNSRERIEPVLPVEEKREAAPVATKLTSEARSASILKSGVIDGMAYTLYTDGSIEAQLSGGTLRFGSIDALRNHLEGSA